ncbi:MAG: hypothetical protein ACSLFI_07440 [Solirubrobacterales bacterium]
MSILVPAGAEGAIKPKDGLYYDSTSVKVPGSGYIQTTGGKIIGVGLNIKFKTSKGKACTPEGFFESSGYVNLAFSTKKTKPNRKNKFSVKNKFSPFNPGLKGTVTGKFKSRTKATFKAVLKADGCTARANYTKAVYTAGG